MDLSAVIPCAGLGNRLKMGVPKPLILVDGKSLFLLTLEKVVSLEWIKEIVLVVNENFIDKVERIVKNKHISKIKDIVPGGNVRSESVWKGLDKISPESRYVFIHDCARPFVSRELVSAMSRALEEDKSLDGIIPGIPVKSTVKKSKGKSGLVEETLDRASLWQIQTPQIFKKDKLFESYKKARGFFENFTDDAQIVEQNQGKIKIIEGEESNIKITTVFDVQVAGRILKEKGKLR